MVPSSVQVVGLLDSPYYMDIEVYGSIPILVIIYYFIDDSFDSFQYETNQVLINFNAHQLVGASCSQLYNNKKKNEMEEDELKEDEEEDEMWKCLYGQYRFLSDWSIYHEILI